MKKKLFRALSFTLAILIVLVTLAACGKDETDETDASSDDEYASPELSYTGEVFVVHAAYDDVKSATQSWTAALNELERRSGGGIKVRHYYAGSLLTSTEIPEGMSDGVAQWACLSAVNYTDVFPLSCRIMQLPFMGLRDPIVASEIFMQLFDEFPEIAAEMEPYNMLPISVSPLGGCDLHLTSEGETRTPAFLTGKSIVSYRPELQRMFSEFNAESVDIPPEQMHESLKKSEIDGYMNGWAFTNRFDLHPFLKQHVTAGGNGFFQEFYIYVVALDQYESMPADLQNLWTDLWRNERVEAFEGMRGYEFMWDETKLFIESQIEYAWENNHLFIELIPQEIQIWKDEIVYTHQMVLDEINAQRGDLIATAVYNRAIELITQKYGS